MFSKSTTIKRNVYCVRIAPSFPNKEWDKAVEDSPGGHIEQTSLWAKVKSFYDWNPIQLSLNCHGQLIGGALILLKHIRPGLTIGFISRGPFCLNKDTFWIEKIVAEIDRYAKKRRLAYLVVLPHYEGHAFHESLMRRGYVKKPNKMPPSNLVTYTTLIDLQDDLDTIQSRIKRKERYNIRRGLKDGPEVKLCGAADIEIFRKLMWKLCSRRGVSPAPPQKDYFKRLWRVFSESEYIKLFLIYYNNIPVSGIFSFAFKNSVQVWKVGWSGEYASSKPNNVIHWEVIKWAKQNGFNYVDLVQIIPEHAKAFMRNEKVGGPYAGVTKFKMGFGGKLVALPAPLFQSYMPLISPFLRLGCTQFFSNPKIFERLSTIVNTIADRKIG